VAKIDTIKTSFVGGQFSASLFGRTDIAQYANACETVENFLIRPFGPVISTPGTEFIAEGKTGGSTGIIRLINFTFSRTDAYVIEMGVGYFRFYTAGAVVVSPGTTPYEIAHTYTASEIPDIQFSQLNDVITIDHADHPIAKLTRLASTSWTLADAPIIGGPFQPDNLTATKMWASTVTSGATVSVTTSAAVFVASGGSNVGHVGAYFKLGVTSTDATTGLDVQGYFKVDEVVSTTAITGTVMALLSSTGNTTNWAEGSWSGHRGYPARITFHQQRQCHARTETEPQNAWCSKSFDYDNYAVDGGADDDALNLQLTSNESNDIKWITSGRDLVLGTYGGEFKIGTSEGVPLTPTTAVASHQTSWGSEAVIPKRIGNFIYYVQRFARKLRETFYNFNTDEYKSIDKTILSPDISSTGFLDLTYQQNPDTILWALCSDGTIATMTREVDQDVQAWAKQTTDGLYESITSIPSATEPHDEVWVVVNRTIEGATKRYIERFKSQVVPDRQDKCFYVHSGLSYDAFDITSSPTSTTISMAATAGTSIVFTTSSTRFVAGDVGDRIRAIDSDGVNVGTAKIIGFTSGTIVVADIQKAFATPSIAAGSWGLSVTTLSGLDHLEGEVVTVLADGGTDKPNKTVSNGSITLAYDYFVIAAGLPYTQIIKTLPQEAGSERGTSQGKVQRINEVGFKVNRSFKGFKIGGTVALLDKIAWRDPTTEMGTPELLFTGTIPNLSFRADYQYGSVVLLHNEEPLPIELLNIITSLDTHDK
jgi:hypothetical protein